MGKINQGILGGFSGKVGQVVGGNWKGISYMRVHAIPSNPKTEKQVSQRSKFTTALHFLQPITPFLRTGYKLFTTKQTAFNAAMSQVLLNAVTGTSPDFQIDYSKVLVSRGSLTSVIQATAEKTVGTTVKIDWIDNSGSGTALGTDKAMILAYNGTKYSAVYEMDTTTRILGTVDFELPSIWVNDTVEVYLGFISEDGKNVSDSIHLSSVQL
jgi:hypothetical protein